MTEQLPAPLENVAERAAEFARSSRSPSTQRAYKTDVRDFLTWCKAAGREFMPPDPRTVGLYLAARAGVLKVATLRRRIAAISVAYKLNGHRLDTAHPAIADVLAGIRRQMGSQAATKHAITVDELRAMIRKLPDTLAGKRDRAALLIGFAGAFRRSELAALTVEDLKITSRGVAVCVRRSKTDQAGLGHVVGIPMSNKTTCPVRALEAWLAAAGIAAGPVFRPIDRHGNVADRAMEDEAVAAVVKRAAARLGLDPRKYAGHSLRRGFMTAASAAGADLAPIMKQSRHRSVAVAMGYIDDGQLFSNPASRAIGL
jgi:integrase